MWFIALWEGLEYFMGVWEYLNLFKIILIILFLLCEIQHLISNLDS